MGWSGGNFSRTNGVYSGANVWASDDAAGIDIEAARHDTHDEDLADGIDSCLEKSGTNSPSGHLNWLSTELNVNSTTGSSSNYTASLSNAPSSYFTGLNFKFRPNHTNTGASTINVNALGSKDIKIIEDDSGTKADPLAGHLIQGHPAELYYDGTDFILVNPASGIWIDWTPSLGGSGSMTYSSVTIYRSRYCLEGKNVHYCLTMDGTIGGTPSTAVTFSLPITAASASSNVPVIGSGIGDIQGASAVNGVIVWQSSTTTAYIVGNQAETSLPNWTASSNVDINVSGFYEAG